MTTPLVQEENSAKTARKIGRPFPKGKSGNPKGRPKHKFISEALREALSEGEAQALAIEKLKLARKAKHASVRLAAINAIEDRTEGKAPQSIRVQASIDDNTAKLIAELLQRHG